MQYRRDLASALGGKDPCIVGGEKRITLVQWGVVFTETKYSLWGMCRSPHGSKGLVTTRSKVKLSHMFEQRLTIRSLPQISTTWNTEFP